MNTCTITCKMRFTLGKAASCGSERIGTLTGFAKSPNAVIETPAFGLLTQGGSVVHLTAEVLAKVFSNPQLLWVPLSNSIHLENGVKAQGEGLAKFIGLQEHVTCVTFSNMNEETPAGYIEGEKLPLWTKQGKKMITADRYMDVMEILKPDIILAVADSRTTLSDGIKRISKSVDRTCSMLDKCVNRYKGLKQIQNTSLIGVVVGSADEKKCRQCIDNILKHKDYITGVALSGVTDGSEDSYKVPNQKLGDIFRRVGDAIPKDLVRFVEGCWNPAVIVSAIEHGWDVFDGSYTVKLTNAGQALTLNFDVTRKSDQFCIMDLNNERYNEDFGPILEGCECLTCKKHSRAYIRHLLNTREMLASVLLSIHNLHHFDQLFEHARRHIAAGTFAIYKDHIIDQYELVTSQLEKNQVIILNGKEHHVTELETGKETVPVKKVKVSNGDVASTLVNGS